MAANSTVIIPSTSHNSTDANPISLVGSKYKGAGFYGLGDGFHTVQIQTTTFSGTIQIQGTLASNPTDEDWINVRFGAVGGFAVDTTGLITTGEYLDFIGLTTASVNTVYNFTGNFVWIRANISNWTAGTVNQVLLNF